LLGVRTLSFKFCPSLAASLWYESTDADSI